ncbi:MAG: hypothetical protein AAFS10_17910, partial [Myxococcota bacterium]
MRLHGLGGAAIVAVCLAAPVGVWRSLGGQVTAFQLVLVAFAALLVGLSILQWASRALAKRLRAKV